MALLDKLEHVGEKPYLAAHTFTGIVTLWLQDEVTANDARVALEASLGETLTAGEITAFLEIETMYDNELTDAQKNGFLHSLEAYTIVFQDGLVSRSWYKTKLGITSES